MRRSAEVVLSAPHGPRILRPHEENGAVVLDAAVRSWPPIDPTCLRWEFPVWTVDESLDPLSLKSERPGKKKEQAQKPSKPEAPSWDAERFVAEFFSDEPLSIPELRELVKPMKNLPMRRAEDLLSIAESRQLIERRKLPGRGGPVGFVLPSRASEGGAA